MSERDIIRIAVSGAAKTTISEIAKKHDMKEMGVASRIYEWFGAQDDVIQKTILRLLPEGYEAEIGKLLADRLQANGPTPNKLVGHIGGKRPISRN